MRERRILWLRDYNRFLEDFPNYCHKCDGWGGHWTRYDPSPSGISLPSGYMEDFDPCECVDNGECPRCRQMLMMDEKDEHQVCHYCNWTSEDPEGLPQEPEPDFYESERRE